MPKKERTETKFQTVGDLYYKTIKHSTQKKMKGKTFFCVYCSFTNFYFKPITPFLIACALPPYKGCLHHTPSRSYMNDLSELHEWPVGAVWMTCRSCMNDLSELHEWPVGAAWMTCRSCMNDLSELHEWPVGAAWMSCRSCVSDLSELHECPVGAAWMSCRSCINDLSELHECPPVLASPQGPTVQHLSPLLTFI